MHGQTTTTSRDGQKSQPWKKFWPPQDGVGVQVELTAEEMNLQRSYGTHASNTKGKIFVIDNKPKSRLVRKAGGMRMLIYCYCSNLRVLKKPEM